MFNFRLLLFFVGVIALLLLAPATYSQGYGYGAPMYPSYGYGYSAPSYPAYGNYGGYGKPSYGGGSYSESCGYMKVIEVLDQIFCTHIDKRRYSSTIYPYIEVIIDQIEYTKEFVCIPNVYDYLTAAQHELETLQDAVYALYSDSSLLKEYYEYYYDCDGCSTTQTSGTQGTSGTQATPARVSAQNVNTRNHERVDTAKSNMQIFMHQKQANTQGGTSSFSQLQSQKTKTHNSQTDKETIQVEIHQRSSGILDGLIADSPLDSDNAEVLKSVVLREVEKDLKTKRGIHKRLASTLGAREAGQRKTRGSEYTDYTCSYIPYAYCDEDYYDELLYNILTRLWTALDFLWEALVETWWFISELDCSTWEDRCALIEASIMYGAIGTEYYFLVEIADYVERMYELMELDYGDESYYRAGGGNDTYYSSPVYSSSPSPQPVYQSPPVMMKKPVPAYIASVAAYSSASKPPTPLTYSYYMSSPSYPPPSPPPQSPPPPPPSYPPMYQPPQHYRQQRSASSSSSYPSVFLVG